jgi:RNA polymerase sigma factor for flagellar operon FliA
VPVAEYRENLEHLVHVTVGSLDQLEHNPRASEDESPRQHSERREILGRIRTALGTLPQRDVLVLSLYYNDEMTYVEIAEVLGVTTSRVCQLHGRAIARLRAALEEVQPEAQARLAEGTAEITSVERGDE